MLRRTHHISYVIGAAEHGSFRRAAAALGVHESAISRQIRDIEYRLGTRLFIRSPTGVQITAGGKAFVQRGREAITQIGLGRTEVRAIGQSNVGEIRIGVFSAVGAVFLSEPIAAVGAAHPELKPIFLDGDHAEHIGFLRHGSLDIAFITGTSNWPGCETQQMWIERVFVALPRSHCLWDRTEIGWKEIRAERPLVSEIPPGPEIHDYLIQRLSSLAHHPLIEHREVGRLNSLSFVALGRRLTLGKCSLFSAAS